MILVPGLRAGSPTSGWRCVLRPALVPEDVPPSTRFGPAPLRWVHHLRARCVWGLQPFASPMYSFGMWSPFGSKVSFKNTKNLFIHIALIPEGDNPRVNPNILKCLLHSPVAKGYRLVVIASRAIVCKTPTYYLILNSLAFARGCVILRSHILFPLLLILLISHHI